MKIEELKTLNYTEKINQTSSDLTLVAKIQSDTLPFQKRFKLILSIYLVSTLSPLQTFSIAVPEPATSRQSSTHTPREIIQIREERMYAVNNTETNKSPFMAYSRVEMLTCMIAAFPIVFPFGVMLFFYISLKRTSAKNKRSKY